MALLTKPKEEIYNKIKSVIRNSLGLNKEDLIPDSYKLIQLNEDTDSIDILSIYYDLGLEFMKHFSGERLIEKGVRFLEEIAEFKLADPACEYTETNHFYDLAKSKTIQEYINQLTVNDLIEIKQHDERLKLSC